MKKPVLLDTQLLVLLVVGETDPSMIEKHRALKAYTEEDYILLQCELGENFKLVLLPYIVAETSNWLRQRGKPDQVDLMISLANMISQHEEFYVPSTTLVSHSYYVDLGIADAAILQHCAEGYEILTADLDLYVAAGVLSIKATNFTHRRVDEGIIPG
jgi:hypothetical protein